MGKTPVKTRKSRVTSAMSTLEARADSAFVKCPAGHSLPHKTDKGKCTPLYCALKGGTGSLSRVNDAKADPEERLEKVKGDEDMRIKVQSARAQKWQEFLQIPIDLKGADAEKYFDEEMVNLLPFALGITKKNLLFGTEEQQERAAAKVMDANGRGKKEAGGNTTPSIIINMVNGQGQPTATVEGQVVETPKLALPWRKTPETPEKK